MCVRCYTKCDIKAKSATSCWIKSEAKFNKIVKNVNVSITHFQTVQQWLASTQGLGYCQVFQTLIGSPSINYKQIK